MPTQILELDVDAAPAAIRVRDDVRSLFVVLTKGGRPVGLERLTWPQHGNVSSEHILRVCQPRIGSVATSDSRSIAPVSVIVCTRERPEDLDRCLGSLDRLCQHGHEVIVVDNAPVTDKTRTVAEHHGCRYVLEPRRGLSAARNAGVAHARHDLVAFVDDDVVVSERWVTSIAACFKEPAVACATGLVLPLELETPAQEQFERYCRPRRDLHRRVYSRTALRPSAAGVIGMGANMAFRRASLVELGGFDVRLGAGTHTSSGEETDMFARVLDASHLIVYTPDAHVWHRHRRSMREVESCVFGYGVGVFGFLTKRVAENRDLGAIVTAARWLVGPMVKTARRKLSGLPTTSWRVIVAEAIGAFFGPVLFAWETLVTHPRSGIVRDIAGPPLPPTSEVGRR